MRRYALIAIGLLGTVSPKSLLRLNARLNLVGYENVDQVEPKGWLLRVTRVLAVVALAIGLLDPFGDGQ
ncbi:MAG: hypothetical protein ACOCSN_05900 [Halanaeroarchaeum sp.]